MYLCRCIYFISGIVVMSLTVNLSLLAFLGCVANLDLLFLRAGITYKRFHKNIPYILVCRYKHEVFL